MRSVRTEFCFGLGRFDNWSTVLAVSFRAAVIGRGGSSSSSGSLIVTPRINRTGAGASCDGAAVPPLLPHPIKQNTPAMTSAVSWIDRCMYVLGDGGAV